MATIKQAFNTGKVYIGWYGVCPETGENACVPFDLINAENEHTILPETGTFSVGITGPSRLINSISSFKNTNAVGYNGKETSTATNSFSTLKQLTCGEAYVIYVLPGTDEDNLLSVDIPEFVIGNIESDEKESEEYILTAGCGTGGVDERTPTPSPSITTPECVTSPVTITVESEFISEGNSVYKYITSDSSGAGGLFGCIDVERGSTLTIFVDGDQANLETHPIKITEFRNDGHPGTERTDVTKTDLTEGSTEDYTYSLTWVVPCDETVDKYQYQCEEHAHMRGTINVVGECDPTPTPSPSPSPSPSATETPSPSPSPSATETPSPSPSPSATETPSPSPSPSPSITPSPTITTSPSPSPSATETPSPSPSPSPSITPSPTITSDLLDECCAEGLNEFNVTANTEQEFGSSIITTTTAFTDNVTICVGNPTGGLPFSVKLKKNSDIVGVLTSVGEFDDDTIYYTESNGVCRTCIIEDDECVLEFIPTRDVPNQPQPPQPPPLCCEVNMISHKITNTSEIETDDASSDTITISAISNSAVNGTLCYGYSTGGVPYSVHVKLNDASLCVLTTTGTLNNNKIYFNQDNVCYDGIIDGNNECNL